MTRLTTRPWLLCALAALLPGTAVAQGCIAGCDGAAEVTKSLHCLQCAAPSSGEPSWSCAKCCQSYGREEFGGGYYCEAIGPPPPPEGTYLCKDGECYEGSGTLTKAECESTCKAPGPGSGTYACYSGTCYEGKGTLTKAECDGTCSIGPPPGDDNTWATYEVGGMSVQSVTGGKNASNYAKVAILLHGGGGSGSDWLNNYNQGWFGNVTGIKWVFPTSLDHLWYHSFKNGCGLAEACAYDVPSIGTSASRVASLIEHEMNLLGTKDGKDVFLAGFSQGAQMTGYMQLAHLDFALGGVFVMDGFPLPPLGTMPGTPSAAAKKNATYYGQVRIVQIYRRVCRSVWLCGCVAVCLCVCVCVYVSGSCLMLSVSVCVP
jgi:pimeloyl-ACP methyl ester carboxylesterase